MHEGLNLAAVLQVPAVFVLQNEPARVLDADRPPDGEHEHGRAHARRLGHPRRTRRRHGRARGLLARARAAIERARAGDGPQAVEALSLRMHGHAAHDDGRYMDQERLRTFAERFDPVERLAARLRLDGLDIDALRQAAVDEVAAGLATAEEAPAPDPATLAEGVYATPLEGTDE